MIKTAAILVGLVLVLGSFDSVQGQLSLSSYFCDSSIHTIGGSDLLKQTILRPSTLTPLGVARKKRSGSPPAGLCKECCKCKQRFVQRVFSSDRRVLPYTYTYCADTGAFSIDVGFSKDDKRNFYTAECGTHLYLALDPSKTTLAAEFYYSCIDTMLYKCPYYQVFDQHTGTCVPQYGLLTSGLGATCSRCCEGPAPVPNPLSTGICEANAYYSIKPTCTTCATPFVQQALTETCEPVPGFYTFCAENGRFSLDIDLVKTYEPRTFFTPYCNGINPLVPLDPSKTSTASQAFWDCHTGLIVCERAKVFCPLKNRCVEPTGALPVTPVTCAKACPAPTNYYTLPASPMMPMMPV